MPMPTLSSKAMQRFSTPLISILGPALGSAFLIPHAWIGALLWVAVFQNLHHAAFALLGVALAEGIGRVFRISDTSPVDGSLKANALLAAIAAAWLTEPIAVSMNIQIVVAVIAAVAATIATAALMKTLAATSLPSLLLGYCAVAAMLFAIFPDWTYRAATLVEWPPVPAGLPGWADMFLRTLGALLFLPTLEVGLVLVAVILLWSRVAFVAGLVGWIAGVATATALVKVGVVYYWMPTAYNFFLAGMGLGAVFFLPGRASLAIAAMGGCGASIVAVSLQHLFPAAAFGYLPIASALTIWVGIYALAEASEQTLFRRNKATELPPEEAWWLAAYWSRRSGRLGPFLVLPVEGAVVVSQSTEGGLSHVGPWRYALDLQRPASMGDTAGVNISTIWDAPVTAPAAGIVEWVEDRVPDNPLGVSNYADNWGNYVLIRLDQGGWALLAHLRQGSVVAKPGMRVEIGSYLGRVGNSGRSPIPHLHLQVQNSPELGAPTVPFRLANFLSATHPERPLLQWNASAIPSQGAIVSLAPPNPDVHAVLTSLAPGSAVWTVESDGIVPRAFRKARFASTSRAAITLDQTGRHIFTAGRGGALVSRLDPDAWRVLELQPRASPLLKLLALAVPSIPYAAKTGMTWGEPAPIAPISMARWLGLSLSPYLSEPFAYVRCQCTAVPEGQSGTLTIETHVETPWPWLPSKLVCQFDRLRGPIRLEADFDGGMLVYSLLSFEPGVPLDGGVR
jgi:murein DD-endopeptidase MepM/ murein hydrolase activator NlpD